MVEKFTSAWVYFTSLLRTFGASFCLIALGWLLLWKTCHYCFFRLCYFNVVYVFYVMRDSVICDTFYCIITLTAIYLNMCIYFLILLTQNYKLWESVLGLNVSFPSKNSWSNSKYKAGKKCMGFSLTSPGFLKLVQSISCKLEWYGQPVRLVRKASAGPTCFEGFWKNCESDDKVIGWERKKKIYFSIQTDEQSSFLNLHF